MRTPAGIYLLCIIVVVALPFAGSVAGSTSTLSPEFHSDTLYQTFEISDPEGMNNIGQPSDLENGTQTIRISVRPDGSADISIIWNYPLQTEEDHEAFARLTRDFEQGEMESEVTLLVFERIIDEINRTSDRTHQLEDVSRTATMTNDSGELRLSFRWIGFGHGSNNEIYVNDSFLIGDETWLPELAPSQRLEIHAPVGFSVDRSPAPIVDGSVVWEGPRTFEPGEIEFTYVPRVQEPPAPDSEPPGNQFSPTIIGVFAVLGLILGVGGLIVLLRRSTLPAVRSKNDKSSEGENEPHHEEPDTVDAGDTTAEAYPSDTDLELLSDEERITHLLKANDGRMKQATIVKETKWSNAKVSQLLSAMDEEGTVEKLRIGRENLITLLDED